RLWRPLVEERSESSSPPLRPLGFGYNAFESVGRQLLLRHAEQRDGGLLDGSAEEGSHQRLEGRAACFGFDSGGGIDVARSVLVAVCFALFFEGLPQPSGR